MQYLLTEDEFKDRVHKDEVVKRDNALAAAREKLLLLAGFGSSDGLGPAMEYRIKSSGLGPATYGNCERCGKQCPCHYMQQWRQQGQIRRGWASAGFGHVECLRTGPWVDAPVTHDARA